MKIQVISSLTAMMLAGLVGVGCGASKKSADASAPAVSESGMIREKISEIDASADLVEKSVNLKGAEKGSVGFFSDKAGNIRKIVKKVTSTVGEKTSSFYFDGSDLIASSHLEKNTVKEKPKVLYTNTQYLFKGGKAIEAVMKSVKLKAGDEAMVDGKLAKEKFKAFVPNANILRDELAIVKKLKQLM